MSGKVDKKIRQVVKREGNSMYDQFCNIVNKYPLRKRISFAVKIIKGRL